MREIPTSHADRHAATIPPQHFRRIEPEGRVSQLEPACIALRQGPDTCTACLDACPQQCLRHDDDGFAVGADCLNCGRCAAACPTGALRVKGFEPAEPLPSGNIIRVECWKVPASLSGHQALRVPCLGGIPPSRWLAIAEAAAPRRVIAVDRSWCVRCTAGQGMAPSHPAVDALDQANVILDEIGWQATCIPRLQHDPLPASLMPTDIPVERPASLARRALFRRLGDSALEAAGLAPPETPASPHTLRSSGMPLPERENLLATSTRLATAAGVAMPAAPFVTLRAGASCGHHTVCAGICPTGALTTYEDGDTAGLSFDSWRCIGCSQCVKACPQLALSLQAATTAPESPQRLSAHIAKRCRKCLQPFHGASGEKTCPACQRNETMARGLFGTVLAQKSSAS